MALMIPSGFPRSAFENTEARFLPPIAECGGLPFPETLVFRQINEIDDPE